MTRVVEFGLDKTRVWDTATGLAWPAAAAVVTTAAWWALDVHNLNVVLWADLVFIVAAMKLGIHVRARLRRRRLG